MISPTGKPIGRKDMEAFRKKRDEVTAWLRDEICFKKRLNGSSQKI
jgi:hypothetical protein